MTISNLMKVSLEDRRIKIAKCHPQGAGGAVHKLLFPKNSVSAMGLLDMIL